MKTVNFEHFQIQTVQSLMAHTFYPRTQDTYISVLSGCFFKEITSGLVSHNKTMYDESTVNPSTPELNPSALR
jgi:hypothetical protein